jgi:hypothetical protein
MNGKGTWTTENLCQLQPWVNFGFTWRSHLIAQPLF